MTACSLANRAERPSGVSIWPGPTSERATTPARSCLQANGRITNVDLADAVGLSPSPCLIRVKRLEKAGYIVGYGAQIQLEKLGDVQIVRSPKRRSFGIPGTSDQSFEGVHPSHWWLVAKVL